MYKYTALVGCLDIMGRLFEAGGSGRVYGNPLYFPLSFAMNLKLPSKNYPLIFVF